MGASCGSIKKTLLPDRRRGPAPRPRKFLEPDAESNRERSSKPRRKRTRLDRASLSFVNISFRHRSLEPIAAVQPVVSTERLRPESPEQECPAPQLQVQQPVSSSSSGVAGTSKLPDDVPQDWIQQPKHFEFDLDKDLKSEWCRVYQDSKA